MEIFEEYQICPYTGLRSFTEEESIYFKGREDDIVQATEQLQRNKFLMLTGASGDGKSSLVYAGIIPNARAGFLKSKYTQWCVADFRPERSPFKNLCRALAKQLEIANAQTVEAELQHGFSALVDLYKNSTRYIDVNATAWQRTNDSGRAALKRDAANLIILVDQFEEFFTNPENYHHGVPSRDSNLVLNLLLETARIALEEDLPIYIVFTMRSDYIGQCAAFRMLPEFIGFSHFFVPRLNREEIKIVIRDPALLAGYEITERLIERLLYDIEEGIDQLPILQHSLNRIWHFANEKEEKMDLIHYAMAGGMSLEELPAPDQEKMKQYISSLPQPVQERYKKPSLRNVLDLHANSLCYQATKNGAGTDLQNVTRTVIQATFKGLTKIDEDRAVRNRMTLKEITNIINDETISTKTVSDTLQIFRESGATFLKPYILSEDKTGSLQENDVLDITHESLIRNWDNLEAWAENEDRHAKIYYELRNHLNHWVNSGYSSNFLLTVGALNYFETWKAEVKPNAYWINRYEKNSNPNTTVQQSQQLLDQINLFLRKSKWKNIVGRTIVKYGMKNIVAVLYTLVALILCSLLFVESRKNQNEKVVEDIKQAGADLITSNKVSETNKQDFLIALYRQDSSFFYRTLNSITDKKKKLQLELSILEGGTLRGEYYGHLVHYLYQDVILLIKDLMSNARDSQERASTIESSTRGMLNCYYKYTMVYQDSSVYKSYVSSFLDINLPIIHGFTESPEVFNQSRLDYKYLHLNVETGLAINKFTREDIAQWLDRISVFAHPENKKFSFYSKDSPPWGILKNCIFHTLGIMYSSLGEVDYTKKCFDSLVRKNTTYYSSDRTVDLPAYAFSLALNLLIYGYQSEFESINKYIAQKANIDLVTHYADFLNQVSWRNANYRRIGFYQPINTDDFNDKYLRIIHSIAEREISNAKLTESNKKFRLAMLNKRLGLHLTYNWIDRKQKIDTADLFRIFDASFDYFNKVDEAFLKEEKGYGDLDITTGVRLPDLKLSNYQTFVYPDFYKDYKFGNSRICSDLFFRYLLKRDLSHIYGKQNSCRVLGLWYTHFELERKGNALIADKYYHGDIYSKLLPMIKKYELDTSLVYPELIKLSAINSGDKNIKLSYENIATLMKVYNSLPSNYGIIGEILMHNMEKCFAGLYLENSKILSLYRLSNNYSRNDYLLLKLQMLAPTKLYKEKAYTSYFNLLHSSDSVMEVFRNNSKYDINNPEFNAITSLQKIEDHEIRKIIFNVIKESDDSNVKIETYRRRIASLMDAGDYYYAVRAIPQALSSNYNTVFYANVLDDYRIKTAKNIDSADPWKYYDANRNRDNQLFNDF